MSPNRNQKVDTRPTNRMAHMEYPQYDPSSPFMRRNHEAVRHEVPEAKEKEQAQARINTRNMSGWASEKREVYKPLGPPEEMPQTGAELRRMKETEYMSRKPKLVMPTEKKKGRLQEDEDMAQKIRLGESVTGFVRQFSYQYYQVDLRERVWLKINLTGISGDPDIFVSCDNPSPTIDDHVWRSGAVGDDEIIIECDHPRYILGPYYIGVYAICDSEYELVADLMAIPIDLSNVHLDGPSRGNGYTTLSHMVNQAETRRRACLFGASTAVDKMPPKDPKALFRTLPAHLRQALVPVKGGEVLSLIDGGDPVAADAAPTKPTPAPGGRTPAIAGKSPRQQLSPLGNGSFSNGPPPKPVLQALSVLTTPYLTDAYFGGAIAPVRGKSSAIMQEAQQQLLQPPPPPLAPTGYSSLGMGGGEQHPSPPSPTHPWLPNTANAEPSTEADVAMISERAPTDLKPLIMQYRHNAMKEDMNVQMRRVAEGITAERSLINHFKSVALNDMLNNQANSALPLAEDVTKVMRDVREAANEKRADLIQQLSDIAEEEQARRASLSGRKFLSPKRVMGKLGALRALQGVVKEKEADKRSPDDKRRSIHRGSIAGRRGNTERMVPTAEEGRSSKRRGFVSGGPDADGTLPRIAARGSGAGGGSIASMLSTGHATPSSLPHLPPGGHATGASTGKSVRSAKRLEAAELDAMAPASTSGGGVNTTEDAAANPADGGAMRAQAGGDTNEVEPLEMPQSKYAARLHPQGGASSPRFVKSKRPVKQYIPVAGASG